MGVALFTMSAHIDELLNINYQFNDYYKITFIDKYSWEKAREKMSELRHSKELNDEEYWTIYGIIKHYFLNSIRIKRLDEKQPRLIAQKFIGKKNVRLFIFNRDKNKCLKCGCKNNLQLDHIIPISKGGLNRISNLQTLCNRCNSTKRDTYKDYRNGGR